MRKGWTDYVAEVRRKGNRGKKTMTHRDAMRAASVTWPKAKAKLISKERIREMRTYKACVQRWVSDCVNNRKLFYYKTLVKKALGKLTQDHFRPNHPGFFVLEALQQVALFLAS